MTKKLLLPAFLFFMLMAAGSLSSVTAQTVTASVPGGAVSRGKATRATVTLSIPGGLHVNSNRPASEYAIPTTVRASARGASVGAVRYPRGVNRKFEFSQDTINVYEGRVSFSFPVTVPANFRGDSIRIDVNVRYQACTNEVCYPPRNKSVTVNARVR